MHKSANTVLLPRDSTYPFLRSAAFPLLAILSLAFLLWRARYGYCYYDEPFIVSLAQRMFQGDALLADEWHVCQNTGPLLLPFYALFRLFSPDNEGLLLFLRYCYCLLWWLSCVAVFYSLSAKGNRLGPALVFLYLILFSPLDNMILSYTSLGLASCLLLCCFLCRTSAEAQPASWHRVIWFSLLWVVLALCCPYAAILYLLFLLFFAAAARREGRQENASCFFRNLWAVGLRSLPVVVLAAAAYLYLFLFSRAELSQILENLPYVLNDPQHESRNFLKVLLSTPGYIFMDAPVFVAASVLVFLLGLLKNCRKYRLALFSLCAGLFMIRQLNLALSVFPAWTPTICPLNYQMMHIGILGLAAFSLMEKRPYKLFFIFQCMGWAYAVVQNLASNSRIYTISMSATVLGVFGILCCLALAGELQQQYAEHGILRRLALVLISLTLCVQIGSELFIRCIRTSLDGTLPNLTGEIRYGCARGLMTTEDKAALHNLRCENLYQLLSQVDTVGKRLLCTSETPHVYLDADLDYGTFSSWNIFFGQEAMDQRIRNYLAINPENQPDLIFCESEADILPFIDSNYQCIEYRGSYLFFR